VRTTVTLDEDTSRLLQEHMRRRGITFKQALNDALRAGLTATPQQQAFVVRAVAMGSPRVDLDKALALAADLEDDELIRKMALRK